MKAYTVVGPTNVQPRRFRSFASVRDWSVVFMDPSAFFVTFAGLAARVRLERPEVSSKRAVLACQVRRTTGIVDGGFDLPAVPDDPSIAEQTLDVAGRESRNPGKREVGERTPEVLTLPENRQPAQASLKAFQTDLLEEPLIVIDRTSPLRIVVRQILRRRGSPPAAGLSV